MVWAAFLFCIMRSLRPDFCNQDFAPTSRPCGFLKAITSVNLSCSHKQGMSETAMPTMADWTLGFATAAVALEAFFTNTDRQGLLIIRGPLHVESLNMPGGCLPTVHYPLVELILLGSRPRNITLGANRISVIR